MFKLPYNWAHFTLAMLCSQSFKPGFSIMWTESFHMYKLGSEKAEEPEIKLPVLFGSWRKQGSSRKISTSASLKLKLVTLWITTNFGKFLDESNRSFYLSPEKPVWVKKQQSGQTWNNWHSNFGKDKGCILSPCLFTFCAEYIMQKARLDETQAGIKIAERNINLRYADDTTVMAESEEEQMTLLMRVKEESENTGLKHSI